MRRFLFTVLVCLLLPVTGRAAENGSNQPFTLACALQIAFTNNPSLREADQVHNSALAEVRSARTDFLAKASAHYSFTGLQDAPYQRINGTPMQVADRQANHWDVTVSQPLFTGFAITSRYQMAKIAAQIKDLEKQRTLLDISQAVKTAWFTSLLTGKIEKVAADTVAALTAHEKDAEGFFRHGVIPQNDLLKSRVALANATLEQERARANTQIALARLYTVIGIGLNSEHRLEDFDTITPASYDLPALTTEAIAASPVLASYRLGLVNLDEAITLAKSAYYPEIALQGRLERNGADFGADTNAYANEHNAAVLVTAKWDFFEWGKTEANVDKQKRSKLALMEKIKGVEDQIRLETKSALLDLNVAANTIHTARTGLQQAKENARITNLQYLNQITTSTEVLDAQSFLSQAESNYYRALYGYMVALAGLERAVGRQ